MLNIITVKPLFKRLDTSEVISYLPIPEKSYAEIEPDLNLLAHFKSVKDIDLTSATDGVIIRCKNRSDGLLAAIYLTRKYEMQVGSFPDAEDDDFPSGEAPYDSENDDDDELDSSQLLSLIYNDDGVIVNLPVITTYEFKTAFVTSPLKNEGIAQLNYVVNEQQKSKKPYWADGKFPLLIIDPPQQFVIPLDVDVLRQAGRFIIQLFVESTIPRAFSSDISPSGVEKKILFDLDFGFCYINEPSDDYYKLVLSECCRKKGYSLSSSLDKVKLIEDLKRYRGLSFDGASDVLTLVDKAVKKKQDKSKVLTLADFQKVFIINELHKPDHRKTVSSARSALDSLIGLDDVKAQLHRIIANLKFAKQRHAMGYKTSEIHTAAVFMGSPGTAKTTVARIFGQILFEENVLASAEFLEVARKDLIGAYVGWTAKQVGAVFEQAQGGTIFIDEAYSLISEGTQSDGYSAEALSEIVRHMENNPNTLVIFAGYTDKMRNFIKMANPGLRSRLTNVIEFKDYTTAEMFAIFEYLLGKEDFVLEDREIVFTLVSTFVDDIKHLGSENTGNGRLMRKLFKTAVGFMAQREDNDLKTITTGDIENAISEIKTAEILVVGEKTRQVGFTSR